MVEATSAPSPVTPAVLSGHVASACLAALASAGTIFMLVHRAAFEGSRTQPLDPLGLLLALLASLPLLWWPRAPLAVFVLSAAASAPLLRYQPVPPLAPTIALYLLAASRDTRHPWTRGTTITVSLLFSIHLIAAGAVDARLPMLPLLVSTLGWAAAWFAGDRSRLQREHIADLQYRAYRAGRDAEQRRTLAVIEERIRIARDLHDSAGHAINVILVQAGAARLLHELNPEASLAALETVECVARQTVTEIDELITTMRDPSQTDFTSPTPIGLASLPSLVDRHRANGIDVTIEQPRGGGTAADPSLPLAIDHAAYRIVQEALTNAARHGTGAVHVAVAVTSGHLEILVANPMAEPADPGNGGHGLIGMRERTELLGGTFEATTTDSGFEIRARLPLDRRGR